jgi:hypothetical protein
MNFNELLKTLEAIDKGQQIDEFSLNPFKKKEQPAQGQQVKPGQSGNPAQPAQPGDAAKAAVMGNQGALGNAARALSARDKQIKQALGEPVDEAKADKDYDGDGEVESDKDEVWGSRMKAAKQAGKMDEEVVDECGMMGDLSAPMGAPKQQDSVSMNVSMNGSGAGGIRDLLNVLKDIQDGPSDKMSGDDMDMGPDMDTDAGPDILLKKNIDSMASTIDDDFANSAPGDEGPKMGGVDMMTKSGDDLHKEKGAYPKASGGDNAMRLKDGATYKLPKGDIQVKLENLYQEIKKKDQLKEVSLELAKRAKEKATDDAYNDGDDLRGKEDGHSYRQSVKFQKYIDKKEKKDQSKKENISEISGELADKVATARRKQADDARDKDPKSDDAKRKKRKADDAQWSWIKRMSRDNYRGKSQAEINKGYADDADKNTKRGWSND